MNENQILEEVIREKSWFKIKLKLSEEFTSSHTMKECFIKATDFFSSEEYQIRVFSTFILGNISSICQKALNFLKNTIGNDKNWRVQETQAIAFAKYYTLKGYNNSKELLNEWLTNKNPNLRRAIIEELRIWTSREYFRDHPEKAVKILSNFKNDESEYVRKSAGNSLKDISRKYYHLVMTEIRGWDVSNKKIAQTYELATKFLNKKGIINEKL